MTTSKRAGRSTGAAVAGAVVLALFPAGMGVAHAATPPAPQPTDAFCAGVADDFDPFEDIAGDQFEREINCLAWADITWGAGAGDPADPRDVFRPRRVVTRGQMATFIARTIDAAWYLDEEGTGIGELPEYDEQHEFTDVPWDHAHVDSINRLAQAGIALGGPGGLPATRFGPGLPVTRAQMATFIARADALLRQRAIPKAPDYFTDDAGSTHQRNINAVASLGIAVGDGRSRFSPDRSVTRSHMSAFLIRTLARLHADGLIEPVWDHRTFPDPAFSSVTATDNRDGTATLTFDLRNDLGEPIVGLTPDRFALLRMDEPADADWYVFLDDLIDAHPTQWSFQEVGAGVYRVVHTSATDTSFTVDAVFANWSVVAEDLRITVTNVVR